MGTWCGYMYVEQVRGAGTWCGYVVQVHGAGTWCGYVVRVCVRGAGTWCGYVVRVRGAVFFKIQVQWRSEFKAVLLLDRVATSITVEADTEISSCVHAATMCMKIYIIGSSCWRTFDVH